MSTLPSEDRYLLHLRAAAEWLLLTIQKGRGGSAANFSPLRGWSHPYPETTGYIVPTLLDMQPLLPDLKLRDAALGLGEWLKSIQNPDGSWQGSLYVPGKPGKPSVFNTGQILMGMCALYRATQDKAWLECGRRGAAWLAASVGPDGQWQSRDYLSDETPSYYTHVTWPMLDVWRLGGQEDVRDAAVRVLRMVLGRRQENGAFLRWGFDDRQHAFTHTIAYTLRGLIGSAEMLDDWKTYGVPTLKALERLLRQGELANGRLAGAYDTQWGADKSYCCLTGNVQVASCLLHWDRREPDLRLVSAAAKMIDYVCSRQRLHSPFASLRGAVAGSYPLWGKYMIFRYPNWAAKFHCDAILELLARLRQETSKA